MVKKKGYCAKRLLTGAFIFLKNVERCGDDDSSKCGAPDSYPNVPLFMGTGKLVKLSSDNRQSCKFEHLRPHPEKGHSSDFDSLFENFAKQNDAHFNWLLCNCRYHCVINMADLCHKSISRLNMATSCCQTHLPNANISYKRVCVETTVLLLVYVSELLCGTAMTAAMLHHWS